MIDASSSRREGAELIKRHRLTMKATLLFCAACAQALLESARPAPTVPVRACCPRMHYGAAGESEEFHKKRSKAEPSKLMMQSQCATAAFE